MNKRKLFLLVFAGFLIGACFAVFCTSNYIKKHQTIFLVNDTVVVFDTVTYTNQVYDTSLFVQYKTYYKTVNDTVVTFITDSASVTPIQIPISYNLYSIPDTCDVYYHGFDAGIDSLKLYCKTTTITNTVFKEAPSNLIQLNISNLNTSVSYSRKFNQFYIGAGVGYSYQKQPTVSINLGYSF